MRATTTTAKITWAPNEIPAAFSVAESTVRRDIASGALPSVKFGRRRLVRRADLARWLGIPETDLLAPAASAA